VQLDRSGLLPKSVLNKHLRLGVNGQVGQITQPDMARGLDRGWGAGATMAGYPASPKRRGTFASSDKAEGPLSQLTISLSCEPPSAAGARLQRPAIPAEQPDRVPRQQ
jgi:hypothetical protein